MYGVQSLFLNNSEETHSKNQYEAKWRRAPRKTKVVCPQWVEINRAEPSNTFW